MKEYTSEVYDMRRVGGYRENGSALCRLNVGQTNVTVDIEG